MAERQQQQATRRIKWSDRMNSDLLDCKKRAQELVKSDNPPLLENGRKMGYMRVMKDLWEEKGYGDLALTSQNLRDQAARLEKTLGNVEDIMSAGIGTIERQGNEGKRADDNISVPLNDNSRVLQEDLDLHIEEGTSPEGSASPISQEACVLLESSIIILGQINTHQVEYHNREFDTRIKEKPTKCDIENINQALQELMKQQNVFPADNPFCYLWITNCVLYSVVVAFLLHKGWKKQGPKRQSSCVSKQQKRKRVYEEKVEEIRKKISIAKAEVERLQQNRKLTKRGKRNRAILRKECHTISMSSLVGYMERQKSLLRKLKKGFLC